ncbi:MAG: diacylglycerol kinase family protein [Synechococcus sp.]
MKLNPSVTRAEATYPSDRAPGIKATGSDWVRPQTWQVAENLLSSFRFAGMGIWYACRTQRNFRIHVAVTIAVLSTSLWLQLSSIELALVSLTCGLVMALELFNTALEAVVDLTVGDRYHRLAKIAKDCAAASVLISAAIAVLVAAFLLFPPLAARAGLA